MQIKFYGTRGSIPVSDPNYLEFGGNTTSIQVKRDNGNVSILDAGTGIRQLGKDIVAANWKNPELFIGLTHFHWDHIQGFPFFAPAYDPRFRINILAKSKDKQVTSLEGVFAAQMRSEYFAIPMEKMGAKFNFMEVSDEKLQFGNAALSIIKQHHPGDSYGYKMEDNGKVLVICTDLEHGDGIDLNIVEFCKGADLLVHDGQFTPEEYEQRQGWGHSTYQQAIEVAKQAGVKELLITHHDPDHDDFFLEKIEKECRKLFPNSALAREGMEWDVG